MTITGHRSYFTYCGTERLHNLMNEPVLVGLCGIHHLFDLSTIAEAHRCTRRVYGQLAGQIHRKLALIGQ